MLRLRTDEKVGLCETLYGSDGKTIMGYESVGFIVDNHFIIKAFILSFISLIK
jgi:hypothetical protein